MPKLKDKITSSKQIQKIQKNLNNMEKCSVPGCEKTYSKDGKKTLFFRFPLEKKRILKKWLTNINLANWKPLKTDRICSNHFENYNISYKNNVYEVDKYAIPSIKPKIPYCVINKAQRKKKKKVKNEYLIENYTEINAKYKLKLNKKLTGKIATKDMNNKKNMELKLEIPKLNDQLFTILFNKYNNERPIDGKIEKLIEKHMTNKVEVHKSKTIKGVKKNECISPKSPDLFDMTTPKLKNKQYLEIENISQLRKLPKKETHKKAIEEIIQKPCPKSKKINFQSKPYFRLIISPRKCPRCKRLCYCSF